MEAFFTLSVIRDEHRQLTAIIRSLEYLARAAADGGDKPDAELITAILDYVEAFPNRFHHPKEDEYLFQVLRRRSPAARQVLDDLEAEHARTGELVGKLRESLSRCGDGGPAAVGAFAAAVARYADLQWEHMRKEEEIVMPLAERIVSAADWQAAENAFRAGEDPLSGREEFRRLFRLIVRLAPPPVLRLLASVHG